MQIPTRDAAVDRLEQLATAFMEAKILLAAAELRLFDQLRGAGATAAEAAAALGARTRPVEVLLDALAALGLVAREGDRYRNVPRYEDRLLESSPSHYPGLLRHRNRLFRRWAFLEETIRGRPLPFLDDLRDGLTDPAANENFIRAMYAVSHRHAGAVVDRIPLDGVRTIADLGGGPGHYLAEFARRLPEAEPFLVDLPLTLEVARTILAGSDVAARVRFVAWDFYEEPAPGGLPPFDLVFLSQVVHAEDDAKNRALFAAIAARIAPGGRLVVHERTVEEDRSRPAEAALFAVNMLAMTAGGTTYTAGEIEDWGRAAGLVPERRDRLSPLSELITLRKPGTATVSR
ncbi:MAG: acetylserotonin O-methyltransferase [Acidobacteria bacterium]|nr:acetylserotonin O-methyltransferase [Acidobacteriota bacterium]